MLEDSKGKQSLLEAANLYTVTFVSVQIPFLLLNYTYLNIYYLKQI